MKKEHWIDDFTNQIRVRASECAYQELKKVDSKETSYAAAIWRIEEYIKNNHICFDDNELEMVDRALQKCLSNQKLGKYKGGRVGRGILSMENSAMLEEFDNFMNYICNQVRERHVEDENGLDECWEPH